MACLDQANERRSFQNIFKLYSKSMYECNKSKFRRKTKYKLLSKFVRQVQTHHNYGRLQSLHEKY